MLQSFLSPESTALKICGITSEADATRLADLGVDALGANFWPKSKRYLDPANADFLSSLAGRILRVGVFVNADPDHPIDLFQRGLIDLIQLHGDESAEQAARIRQTGAPLIKALGVIDAAGLEAAIDYPADALLLDAHAPGVYGGTGETIDWNLAADFISRHREIPVILAGGITPANVGAAVQAVHPAAIDIASGAETSPGVKDFEKVSALLQATRARA